MKEPYPKSYSFNDVNEFVYSEHAHYENLQWLCLSMATHMENRGCPTTIGVTDSTKEGTTSQDVDV